MLLTPFISTRAGEDARPLGAIRLLPTLRKKHAKDGAPARMGKKLTLHLVPGGRRQKSAKYREAWDLLRGEDEEITIQACGGASGGCRHASHCGRCVHGMNVKVPTLSHKTRQGWGTL